LTSLHLTKSRYIAGLQCLRRLWLRVNEPQPYEESLSGSPMDVGSEVGRKAHLLFPGGALIDEEPWQHAQALARTTALMTDERVFAIFEGAFEYDGISIRVDVLERLASGTWGLREVKSSARPKDNHYDDIAIQLHVLNGSGVAPSSIELVHVNSAYVRGAAGMSWPEFFTRVDVTDEVAARLAGLPGRLPAMRSCLDMVELPYAEPGKQCSTPYDCEFQDRCTADKFTDWVAHLPRLSAARASQLKALGIDAISSIPPEFPLTTKQVIIRDALVSGRPYVATDIRLRLQRFGPPACYLDFEAMVPTIPLYERTRPYQTIPFQWSLHTRDNAGTLRHQAFLADGESDPRRKFTETLIDALAASDYPIIVYSAYERTQLTALGLAFPDLGVALNGVIARLVDLLPIVRSAVYLPAFRFTNSIKSVAPALCPGFGYNDLDGVADGLAASSAFHQIASGAISAPDEMAKLRVQLLAYCERDTLAMVEAHQALMQLTVPELA
jgi:Domain of unknown function(DUF2779)